MRRNLTIGTFETKGEAILAYTIAREKIDDYRRQHGRREKSWELTEATVAAARRAAFEGVKTHRESNSISSTLSDGM
jgi:hypothetical protein